MSKTITIIELLNRIAKGEELPKQVGYVHTVYTYDEKVQDYKDSENYYLFDLIDSNRLKTFLNEKVEILEDEETIDINDIEEIEPAMNGNACIIDTKTWTLN